MKPRNQIVIVNTGIVAGLVVGYLWRGSMLAVGVSGIFLLLLVNVIFFVRSRRPNKTQ